MVPRTAISRNTRRWRAGSEREAGILIVTGRWWALAAALLMSVLATNAQEAESLDNQYSWTGARQAYSAGIRQMEAAFFPRAEALFQEALRLAPPDTQVRADAEQALYALLPVRAVRHFLALGDRVQARELLADAKRIAADHPQQLRFLTNFEQDMNTQQLFDVGQPPLVVDGRAVIEAVREKLDQYRVEAGGYPRSRAELNRWLIPGEPPLVYFLITAYTVTGDGYRLELASTTNAEQTLRIDHTGLLQ